MVLCGLLLAPGSSQAATIVAVNDTTALFTIKFDFIAGKDAYQIPVGAKQGLEFSAGKDFVGYKVVSSDNTALTDTRSNAVVLRQLPIENGMYQLEAGKRASFTLVGLFTVPASIDETYQAKLISLPHFIGSTRTNVTEARLERFVTDEIAFE